MTADTDSPSVVFYRPVPGGIEVLRVLLGARDLASILAEKFGVERDDDAAETKANQRNKPISISR